MAGWIKLEKFEITEFREGAIYKTKKIASEWHPLETKLGNGMIIDQKYVYTNTVDIRFQKDKPTEA